MKGELLRIERWNLANAFALGQFVEFFEALARLGGVEFPNDFAVRFDGLGATLFVVANVDGVLGGAGKAGFDVVFQFAVMRGDEFDGLAGRTGRSWKVALCHR